MSDYLAFPWEILELILHEVAMMNDRRTLRNFSLASHAFVSECQRKLFHTIDFRDRCISGEEYCRRLCTITSEQPRFRDYIRELRLVDTYPWDSNLDWNWLVSRDILSELLNSLPRLEIFSLHFNKGPPAWHDLHESVQTSLVDLAKRPSIRSYTLSNITHFPPALLIPWCAIRNIQFDRVTLALNPADTYNYFLALASVPNPRLEILTLRSPTSAFVRHLNETLALYAIQTLTDLAVMCANTADVQLAADIWDLFQWAAPTLQRLTWRPASQPKVPAPRPPLPIDISIAQKLVTLSFVVNFHTTQVPIFDELIGLLIQVSSGANFAELIIECRFFQTIELVACGSDWLNLDQTLARPELCGLRTIVFALHPKLYHLAFRNSARAILTEQLPICRSRGVKITLASEQ